MRAAATALLTSIALAGCLQNEQLDLDGDGDADTDMPDTEEPVALNLDGGVDLLIIVDDSISMAQEQQMLQTSVFHLVNSLAHPFEVDFPFPVDDVRAAVISTNMGFSASGESGDALWPGDVPAPCTGLGDDGAFQVSSEEAVFIEADAIPCADSVLHCPPEWHCGFGESCIGRCNPPTPGDIELACPKLGESFAETSKEEPNEDLSLELACLASLGTSGCGFEQQLSSAVGATRREDQEWFFRDNAALGVMIVSDEDDCSMRDNAGLFATDEVANQSLMKVNIACGSHPEFLLDVEEIVDALAVVKGGVEEAVFFAAIVGVPQVDACEGRGDKIDGCLLQPDMQLVPELADSTWYYRPACERFVDTTQVTKAYPGRRFVELAQSFGSRGYVFSICNDDWMPAMAGFANIIAPAMY